jgi:hypothetical protein
MPRTLANWFQSDFGAGLEAGLCAGFDSARVGGAGVCGGDGAGVDCVGVDGGSGAGAAPKSEASKFQ